MPIKAKLGNLPMQGGLIHWMWLKHKQYMVAFWIQVIICHRGRSSNRIFHRGSTVNICSAQPAQPHVAILPGQIAKK